MQEITTNMLTFSFTNNLFINPVLLSDSSLFLYKIAKIGAPIYEAKKALFNKIIKNCYELDLNDKLKKTRNRYFNKSTDENKKLVLSFEK